MILSLLFFALAAICNAVMDVCAKHFYICIFNNQTLNAQWWNTAISWKNKYNHADIDCGRNNTPMFLTDAWHFFKMAMIIFICAGTVTLALAVYITTKQLAWLDFIYMFIIYFATWHIFYGLFYKRILIKQNSQ